ncbi:hypothetical protein T10_10753 [Trichinella papuae]|uniref:FLYWCH-type domain-containing protein n=1 Tax=Trichinella papuae TaxID=268474 RepID=A0A0V1M284_9BILA|nr:hypothetical protein T10_5942 [Trichinella papuae]KRZ65933.1 hypothetical protein T10_10753 [Trichinella papuae]
MADISELRRVPNRGGSTSLVSQGRTYKLRYTNKQKKHWVCSKCREGCKGVIWTNLDVTYVITQKDHIESCPVDEHLAYKMEKKATDGNQANLGIGWYIQGCTTMVSKTVYHPYLFGGKAGASSLLFMYG